MQHVGLPAYADYGVAVFRLKELAGSPHPIALELDTRTPDTLFFPTVHIHDGTVHDKDHFDRVLYAQEVKLDARAGGYEGPAAVDPKTGFVRRRRVHRRSRMSRAAPGSSTATCLSTKRRSVACSRTVTRASICAR